MAIALVLLAAIAIVYAQVGSHDFLNYDDPRYVTANPQVRAGLTYEGIVWAFTAVHDANWIPLTWISHMIDCQLFGVNPGWQHLMNVFIHAVNALLLFLLLKRLTGALWPSAFTAAVFALHPLHVESVAWIAERKDVLCALFFFLTIWAYIRYVERPALTRFLPVIGLFMCAVMAKPMAVTLPVCLLLLDLWPLRRLRLGRRVVMEKLPLFAFAAASSAIAFIAQRQGGAVAPLDQIPLAARAGNALISYVLYIADFIWPANLAVFYPYPAQIFAWQWVAAACALGAVTFLTVRSQRRYLMVGWLWFLVTLLPVIGLVQIGGQSRADRYTYIPMIGITIMVAWGAGELFENHGRLLSGLAVAALAAWAAVSWGDLNYWRNSITIFERAADVTHDNHVAYTNLGDALRSAGQSQQAIPWFEAAVRVRPNDETALEDLGATLQNAGRTGEALPVLEKVLRLRPESYSAHVGLAHALAQAGQLDEAANEYRIALRISPGGAEAQYGLGGVLETTGHFEEARSHLEAGLPFLIEQVNARPNDPDALYNLGTLYSMLHRYDEAISTLSLAVRQNPPDYRTHANLAGAFAGAGRLREAADEFGALVHLRPDDVNAHLKFATALEQLGRIDQAIGEYETMLQLQPNLPEVERHVNALKHRRP